MNWWITVAVFGMLFMVTMSMAIFHYVKAMHFANPKGNVAFDGNLNNPNYAEMLNSTNANVKLHRRKYRTSFGMSVALIGAIAICVFNAPPPKIN